MPACGFSCAAAWFTHEGHKPGPSFPRKREPMITAAARYLRRWSWVPAFARTRPRASNPVPGAPVPEVAAFLAHEAGEHHVVHFRGAVDQARRTRRAIDPFQDRVLGIAARAVELDGDVGRLVQRVGDLHLGHGTLLASAVALVELPRRVHGEQPPYLDMVCELCVLGIDCVCLRTVCSVA